MAPDPAGVVHFVVPHNIDARAHPSGGNRYDRRLCDELAAAGWTVREHVAPGSWPRAATTDLRTLAAQIASIPDCSTVLVDGLIASNTPEVFVPAAGRLRLVVLLHTPLIDLPPHADVTDAHRRELAVLAAARGVVTTSRWACERLLDRYPLPAHTLTVAEPGADACEAASQSADGGRFLCVAAVAPHKGQHVLIDALARVADLDWSCRFVGVLHPHYAEQVRHRAFAAGIGARVDFLGPLDHENVDENYRRADLLLHASTYETYGMVVTEAVAHGLPVVTSHVGGVAEALGVAPSGRRPGLLVPAGDSGAFATAITAWLESDELRSQLRAAAADRRNTLTSWSTTAGKVAYALVAAAERLEVPA